MSMDKMLDQLVMSVFALIGIMLLIFVVVLPFWIMQDYRKTEAEIDYIHRSKHNLDVEIKNGP